MALKWAISLLALCYVKSGSVSEDMANITVNLDDFFGGLFSRDAITQYMNF